jgi:hypothetical protein
VVVVFGDLVGDGGADELGDGVFAEPLCEA